MDKPGTWSNLAFSVLPKDTDTWPGRAEIQFTNAVLGGYTALCNKEAILPYVADKTQF